MAPFISGHVPLSKLYSENSNKKYGKGEVQKRNWLSMLIERRKKMKLKKKEEKEEKSLSFVSSNQRRKVTL